MFAGKPKSLAKFDRELPDSEKMTLIACDLDPTIHAFALSHCQAVLRPDSPEELQQQQKKNGLILGLCCLDEFQEFQQLPQLQTYKRGGP